LRKRPSISATKFAGRPRSWSACSRSVATCCACRRSYARRSCAVRRRRALAFARFFTWRVVGDMRDSFALCGPRVDGSQEHAPQKGERRASASRAPSRLLSFPGHLRYIYGLAVTNSHTILYKPRATEGVGNDL